MLLAASTDEDNSPWTSMRQQAAPVKSSGIGDDEPWELEDSAEAKPAAPPQDTSFFAAFKDDEQFSNTLKSDAPQNFFDDAFNPTIVEAKQLPISSRMVVKENKQDDDDDEDVKYPSAATADPAFFASNLSDRRQSSIDVVITQPDHDVEKSKSSTTSDSDELEINEIKPTFTEQVEPAVKHVTEEVPAVSRTCFSLLQKHLTRENLSRLNDRSSRWPWLRHHDRSQWARNSQLKKMTNFHHLCQAWAVRAIIQSNDDTRFFSLFY